ncbi:MAG: aldehyde dehydrogenase, partial [Acidobacteria bacterium]|nr:aldehyde dehydrogenase [Acidobacteriota bacterium]
LPELKGKFDGISVRVPTPNVSLVDLTFHTEKPTSAEEINDAVREAANGELKGILAYSDEQLVSVDFNHNGNSSILDTTFTRSVDPHMHKVLSWYDNEWGYSNRILDLIAYVAKVLHEKFRITMGIMTTVHSYTNDQEILDLPHKDLRRGRAAALSMIPTTTGAAKAVGLVLPELKGKFDGISVRVPTPNVSLVDLTFRTEKATSADEINQVLRESANGALKGILTCSEEQLVSVDFNHNPYSAIVDTTFTRSVGPNMHKVLAWYDNEWGYSNRILELIAYVARVKKESLSMSSGG